MTLNRMHHVILLKHKANYMLRCNYKAIYLYMLEYFVFQNNKAAKLF